MDKLLTIRQMCDLYQVTARTLRFYEDKELIAPIREGQKRLYTKREQARVRLILRGKRFGFSLNDIHELLDLYYMGDQQKTQIQRTYDLGKERLAAMESQRAELDVAIAELKVQLRAGVEWLEKAKSSQTA
ncbi:MAG: MerR family DNA-binding transcriptional regulator [Rhodobacterales bacterium]